MSNCSREYGEDLKDGDMLGVNKQLIRLFLLLNKNNINVKNKLNDSIFDFLFILFKIKQIFIYYLLIYLIFIIVCIIIKFLHFY